MAFSARKYNAGVVAALAVILVLTCVLPRWVAGFPGFVGVAASLCAYLFRRDPLMPRPWAWSSLAPALVPGLIAIALGLLSSLWSIDPADTLKHALGLAVPVIPGVMLISVARTMPSQGLGRLWWLVPVAVAISAAILIIEYDFNYPLFRFLRGIPKTQFVPIAKLNRSTVAVAFIALSAVSMLYLGGLARGWGRMKSLLLPAGFSILIMLLMDHTDSQSAQLAFVLGLAVLIVAPVQYRWFWTAMRLGLCLLILVMPWLCTFIFAHVPHVKTIPGTGDQTSLIAQAHILPRLEIWDFVARYALKRPLIGFGMEATRNVPAFDTQEYYHPTNIILHPHNGLLQIWIEFGLVGAVLTCIGAWLLLKAMEDMPDVVSRRTALAVFIAFLSVGVVAYGLWQSWWIGLMILLAAIAVILQRMALSLAAQPPA